MKITATWLIMLITTLGQTYAAQSTHLSDIQRIAIELEEAREEAKEARESLLYDLEKFFDSPETFQGTVKESKAEAEEASLDVLRLEVRLKELLDGAEFHKSPEAEWLYWAEKALTEAQDHKADLDKWLDTWNKQAGNEEKINKELLMQAVLQNEEDARRELKEAEKAYQAIHKKHGKEEL